MDHRVDGKTSELSSRKAESEIVSEREQRDCRIVNFRDKMGRVGEIDRHSEREREREGRRTHVDDLSTGFSTSDDFSLVRDQDEIRHGHQSKSESERVDPAAQSVRNVAGGMKIDEPERRRVDGVPHGEMACDSVVVSLIRKDSNSGAESFLEVRSLFEFVGENRGRSQGGHLPFAHVERGDLVGVVLHPE